MKNSMPTLDAAIEQLRRVPTECLIGLCGGVNKNAKTPAVGEWFQQLQYLFKDAAISILLPRPECRVFAAGTRPDGAIALTICAGAHRTDVHVYPWRLSAKAASIARKHAEALPVVFPVMAERLATALAAA